MGVLGLPRPPRGYAPVFNHSVLLLQTARLVLQRRAGLIQTVASVMPIVDSLGTRVHPELYAGIQAERTRQDQMRRLYTSVLDPGGTRVRAAFYDALKQHQPHLIGKIRFQVTYSLHF